MPPRLDALFGVAASLFICCSGKSPAPPAVSGPTDAAKTEDAAAGGAVTISGVYNARQTGGLVATGGVVRQDVVIRSGHLGAVDTVGCQQFQSLGIRTIIDLRDAVDAASTPDVPCTTSTASYHLVDLPKILPPSEATYVQTFLAVEPKVAEIFSLLSKATALPAVIHCVIGRDRASIVTAIVLLALGVPAENVIADFTSNQDPSIQVDGAWMHAVVGEIDKRGGIDAWLASVGVPPDQLVQLRSMVLQTAAP